jgi:hypothetical protein
MQTDREAEIVAWLGRMGAATCEQVAEHADLNMSKTYSRLRLLIGARLVQHQQLLHRFPGMYTATWRGLRWQGLSHLTVFPLSPTTFKHTWQCTEAAVALEGKLPGWELLSERDIRVRERDEDRLIVSARAVRQPDSGRRHRADLGLISPTGRVTSIEVELMCKDRRTLENICRAWARARHVDHVYYLAEPTVVRTLKRAIAATRAADFITVLDIGDTAGLVERELAREQDASRSAAPSHGIEVGR